MSYTGADFHREFQRRVDKPFNDYYDDQTSRDFYRRVLTLSLKEKYEVLDGQSRFDHLRGMIKFGAEFAASSGRIMLQPIAVVNFDSATGEITTQYQHNALVGQNVNVSIVGDSDTLTGSFQVLTTPSTTTLTIAPSPVGVFETGFIETEQSVLDYLHLKAIRVTYKIPSVISIKGIISKPNSVVVKFTTYTKIRTGEKVFISGVTGVTNANGDRYLKQISPTSYQLYTDELLQVPVLGNGEYISGGTIFIYHTTKQIFQSKPDEIQTYDRPTFEFPRWRMSENAIVIEPAANLSSVKFDYLTLPPFEIDPENDTLDLLLFVPLEMIEFMIDRAATLFDLETKNWNSLQADNAQIIINK